MGRNGASGVDPGIAESLLGGRPHHAGGADALGRLLTAATAPAYPHELAGEDAAVAAFRRPGTAPARRPGRRVLVARLLTVKVTAAFAVTAVGGAALAAAATGSLPQLPGTSGIGTRPTPPGAPAPSRSAAAAIHNRGTRVSPTTTPQAPTAASPSASPYPTLLDLCRSIIDDSRSKPGEGKRKDLNDPTFAPLVAAAGSNVKVRPFCVRLLRAPGVGDAAPPDASPTPRSGDDHDGSGRHANNPTDPRNLRSPAVPFRTSTPGANDQQLPPRR